MSTWCDKEAGGGKGGWKGGVAEGIGTKAMSGTDRRVSRQNQKKSLPSQLLGSFQQAGNTHHGEQSPCLTGTSLSLSLSDTAP